MQKIYILIGAKVVFEKEMGVTYYAFEEPKYLMSLCLIGRAILRGPLQGLRLRGRLKTSIELQPFTNPLLFWVLICDRYKATME